MANTFSRTDRIAGVMQRELTQLIKQEVKDPRLPKLITISAVKVSKDLSHAKVYFTVFNDDAKLAASILNAAASYLRTHLAKIMTMRTVPQLHFIYDESVEYGKRLSRLIDEVNDSTPDDSKE